MLEKCIHIGILDFEIFEDTDAFYSRFHLWEGSRHIKNTVTSWNCMYWNCQKLAKAPVSGDRTAKLDAIYQCRDRGEFKMAADEDPYIEEGL